MEVDWPGERNEGVDGLQNNMQKCIAKRICCLESTVESIAAIACSTSWPLWSISTALLLDPV
jgi:hypothetical protein